MIPLEIIETKIIHARPSLVWRFLTKPELMKQWMGEADMNLEIHTDWKMGEAILIKGFHHTNFENKGTVLQFIPYRVLSYNYLSSVSGIPDIPENRTSLEFKLTPIENLISLTLTISNFPTEVIFKHLDFYWKTTLEIVKISIEAAATKVP